MQTPKKRKRETVEVVHPRITYDAPSRIFDRLFKEDSLEEMKDVVRKKLGVANSVLIHLSQVRHGKSIDLEDDDDFDAFHTYAHERQSARVKVVISGDSESSVKKKKKSNTTVSSSAASSPLQKRRRVSFVEPPGDQPEQRPAIPTTPDKKKRKHVADSSGSSEDEPLDTNPLSTDEGKEEKKKELPATASDHTEDGANGGEAIPETPSTKRTTKRTRVEDPSQVFSSSHPDSIVDEDDTSQPAEKSKKKRKQADDEPIPPKSSRSKSVPPPSMTKKSTMHLSTAIPSVEPEVSIKSKKGKERSIPEPPSAPAPSSPEPVQHDETSTEKKGKSKVKGDSTTTRAKATKKNKVNLAQQKETQPSESTILDQTTKKKESAAESARATLPTSDAVLSVDKDLNEHPLAAVEPKAPRTRRKSQEAETDKLSEPLTPQERQKAAETIQAILERCGIVPSSGSPQVPQAAPPQPAPQVATSGEEEVPAEEEEPCSLCDEFPTHDRPLCPVIKGGIRKMRSRLGQLEKDTSGDETKQEKRKKVIAELQVMIQKRARKPKTSNATTSGAVTVKKATVTKKVPSPADAAPIVEATETTMQVDVASPPTRVVDVVPPIATSQPVKSTSSTAKSLKSAKQPLPLQPPLAKQQPSSLQKSVAKTAREEITTKNLMSNLPLVTEPSLVGLGDLPFEDLSQVTDNDLQTIIHGRRVSIADVPSSDEDEEEEEEEEEEPFLDEDEPQQEVSRRLSQGSLREYPSSSDAEEEDDSSPERGVSKRQATSLSTEEEDLTDDGQISEGPSYPGEGNTSFREVDTRGSSREIDKTGDDAVQAAMVEDFASLNAAINGKGKGPEVDSDTAVGSQVEEVVEAKKKKGENVTATADPIEPSKGPAADQPEVIASDDDDAKAQSTPKVESAIRTRSQRKKNTEQHEDSVVQAPKTVKKARKITELPVPSLSSVRVTKPSSSSITSARRVKFPVQDHEAKSSDNDLDDKPSMNGKVDPKAIKDTKRSTNSRSTATTSETTKSKSMVKAGSRVSAAKGTGSKPKSLYKITPMEPIELVSAINRASEENYNIIGSQWAVLQESNPLTETPGQVDELLSDFNSQVYQTPLVAKDREPLFLPSETQQSYRYSQFSETFGTPLREDAHEPSHESEDENEVLASVVKPAHPYRGLSQIASSQTFMAPQFQSANSGKTKEPESLYGRNRRDVVSETDSSSESDEDEPVVSHIPASRRAGLNSLKK